MKGGHRKLPAMKQRRPPRDRSLPSKGARASTLAPATGVYFPGLHGLRFFAALAVVVAHIELLKSYHGYPNLADNLAIYELGRLAVTFFFVLSGFLITYLLLEEKREAGTIAIRKFYIRRIFRIWPLYYLVVVLAFVIVPQVKALAIPSVTIAAGDHRSILGLFLVLLPQVALSLYPPFPYAEPLWSIGVEEQFYLFWPLVMARSRNVLKLAVVIIIGGVAVKAGALAYASRLKDPSQLGFWNHFIDYFYFNRFECMAIGAAGAWLLFERKERVLRFLFSKPVQLLTYLFTAIAMLTTRGKPILHYSVHSVLFCIIILNVAANEHSLLKLRANVFTLLGNISYAMYLLHEIVIGVVMYLITTATGSRFDGLSANVVLYAGSAVVTIAVSTLVYKLYEVPFLRLKSRYAVVKSGVDEQASVGQLRDSTA
jgi:peptidoglycan/LPS O-acetylase OafA/YrhL